MEGGGAGIDPAKYARVCDIVIEKADQTIGGSQGNISLPGEGLSRAEVDTVFTTYGGSLFNAVFGPSAGGGYHVDGPYGIVAEFRQNTQYNSFYDEYRQRVIGSHASDLDTEALADRLFALETAISALDDRVTALEGA